MSTNVLGQSRRTTYPQQAAVIGKGFLDTEEIEQREFNAKDGMMGRVYSGGENKKNFDIRQGEIILGERQNHAVGNYTATNKEVGLSTAAGMDASGKSFQQMHDEKYFMGVAIIDQEYGGDLFGREPEDEGIGFNRSGTETVNNHGFKDWHAGDWLAFALPPPPRGVPGASKYAEQRVPDNGINPLAPNIRQGTPTGKPVYYLEPMDPSDFTMNLAGVFWCMSRTKEQHGINDMTMEDYYERREEFTHLQLEAFAWAKGLCAIAKLANEAGFGGQGWNDNGIEPDALAFLASVFRRNVEPGENRDYEKYNGDRTSTDPALVDNFHRDQAMTMLTAGPTRGLVSNLNRVVGRSLSNTKSGGHGEVLLQNTKVGF